MKHKKGFAAVLLTLIISALLSVSAFAASDGFSDVPEASPFYESVTYLAGQGITYGTGNGLAGPYCLHGIGCNRSCLIQSGMSIIVHDGFPFKSNSYANIVHTRHSFAFLSLVLYIPKSALFN